MSPTTDDRPGDELGAELGAALRAGVMSAPVHPLDLRRVERGARRRRNRRRSAATATGVVLTVAMGWALTARTGDRQPAEPPPATSASTISSAADARVLPVYAVPVGDAPPLRMEVYSAMPVGVPLPAVDVYRSGDETFVIRTMPPAADQLEADDTDVTVATTVAEANDLTDWLGRETQPVSVRGTSGALLQLADDQWALRLPDLPEGGETVLIGRAMSSERFLALADGATAVSDGSLVVGAPWARTEHVDAAPALTTSVGPGASVSVDMVQVLMTWLPSTDRGTLETIQTLDAPQAIMRIGATDVLTSDQGDGRASVIWIDPAAGVGVLRSVASDDVAHALDAVRFVDASTWTELAAASSARIVAEIPEVEHAEVDGLTLVHRHAGAPSSDETSATTGEPATGRAVDVDALCVVSGDPGEQCHAGWFSIGPLTSFDASFVIDGEWILAGYRAASQNPYADTDEVRFTSEDGACCEVMWTMQGDLWWYVVRAASEVQAVTTNIGDEFDGPVGVLRRPPTIDG